MVIFELLLALFQKPTTIKWQDKHKLSALANTKRITFKEVLKDHRINKFRVAFEDK